MFGSVSAFASNLTERNVYGLVSDNFTGALETSGQSTDNICFYMWAAGGAPEYKHIVDADGAKEGKTYKKFLCLFYYVN